MDTARVTTPDAYVRAVARHAHLRAHTSASELARRETKRIVNDRFADAMLTQTPPRKGWEEFYKM